MTALRTINISWKHVTIASQVSPVVVSDTRTRENRVGTLTVRSHDEGHRKWAWASWYVMRCAGDRATTCIISTMRQSGEYRGTAGAGYCPLSSAFQIAAEKAGYTPSEQLWDMATVDAAMLAMARDMGATDPFLVWA